jgi:hypothetical protein
MTSYFKELRNGSSKGKKVVLKHVGEGDNFASSRIVPLANDLVIWVIGGGYVAQGIMTLSITKREASEVESIVGRERLNRLCRTEIKGIKAGLRFAQSHLRVAKLENVVRVLGRNAESYTTINNIFPKTYSQ